MEKYVETNQIYPMTGTEPVVGELSLKMILFVVVFPTVIEGVWMHASCANHGTVCMRACVLVSVQFFFREAPSGVRRAFYCTLT